MEKKHHQGLINSKDLRTFAFSFGSGMCLLAVVLFLKRHDPVLSALPLFLGVLHLIFGLLLPVAATPFYMLMRLLLHFIGTLLGSIVFSLIFYIIITPISWLLRHLGKDHLQMKRGDLSTWIPHTDNDPKNIEKQY